MKKAMAFICAVCMALLLSVPAFADGRGPTFTTYDVVCEKDVPYYKENWETETMEKEGTFPAGTTLTIEYEYEQKGVLFGNVEIIRGDDSTDWVYIRLSDVVVKDKTYQPKKSEKLSQPCSVKVIRKGGIPMYAGPNKKYDVVKTIPEGTKLTYEYANDADHDFRTWAYVTHMGKSGWIYVYVFDIKNGVAELPDPEDTMEVWALQDDVVFYDGISFGNVEAQMKDDLTAEALAELHDEPDRVLGTLKQGKKYACRYLHRADYGYTWYYVTAGFRSGWVYSSYMYGSGGIAVSIPRAEQDNAILYKTAKVKLYASPFEKTDPVTVTVSRDTIMNPEYEAYSDDANYYYQTINGKSGWYSYDDIGDACAMKYDPSDTDPGDILNKNEKAQAAPIYEDILSKEKTIGKIPSGRTFTPLYYGSYSVEVPGEEIPEWHSICYLRFGDVTGWVEEDDVVDYDAREEAAAPGEDPEEGETPEEDAQSEDDLQEEGPQDEAEWDEDAFADEPADDAIAPRSGLSARQIVLICVGGAAVLALTAVVTLLLIRRKRKNG